MVKLKIFQTTNNGILARTLEYAGRRMYVKFIVLCLVKKDKVTFDCRKIVNIYVVCDIDSNVNSFDSTLKNCLFGAVKLTIK